MKTNEEWLRIAVEAGRTIAAGAIEDGHPESPESCWGHNSRKRKTARRTML